MISPVNCVSDVELFSRFIPIKFYCCISIVIPPFFSYQTNTECTASSHKSLAIGMFLLNSDTYVRDKFYWCGPLFFCLDLEFVKTFLYTYQSFATPEKLLKKLIERYNVVRPEGMSFRQFAVLRQTIQARVINALRLWVDLSVDFKGMCICVYACM